MNSHCWLNPHLRSSIASSSDVSNYCSLHIILVQCQREESHPTIREGGSVTPFQNYGVDPVPPAILTRRKQLLVAKASVTCDSTFYKPSPSEPLPWTLLPAGRSGRQHWDTTAGVSREQLSLMMKAICQIQTSQIQTVLLNFKKKLLPLIGRGEHRNTRHCSILTLQL